MPMVLIGRRFLEINIEKGQGVEMVGQPMYSALASSKDEEVLHTYQEGGVEVLGAGHAHVQ